MLADHLRKHPEFTGEDDAENTWNKSDLLHMSHGSGDLVQKLESFTSITGASWTSEKHESHTRQFTGPQDLLRELELFCSQHGSSSDSTFTIEGLKRQYKFASNELINIFFNLNFFIKSVFLIIFTKY